MLSYIETFGPYSHFLVSIALGMLVGLQREWADTPGAGIRTFTFITLLGTACALMSEIYGPLITGAGFLATVLFAAMAYQQSLKSVNKTKTSLVTGVTLILMFIVGLMVRSNLILPAAALACLIAMILHVKLELHSLADKITSSELSSVMQFLLITLVILPIMPDQSFGPNDALNLRNIWFMVVLIVGLSLAGYIINKIAGHRSGVIGSGIIGGLISSTATTFSSARLASINISSSTFHALVILIAWLIVYFRVFAEIAFVEASIPVLLPLSLMVVVTIGLIFLTWKKHIPKDGEMIFKNNPVELKTAVSFAILYGLLVFIFSYLKDDVSSSALYAVTFVAGIFDIDAITLTTARLVNRNILGPEQAVSYVFIALFANTLFKGALCLFIGRKPLFKIILIPWIVSLVVQIVIVFWYWR